MSMTLNEGIGRFYDSSSPMWEQQWGEHMHHGFYGMDGAAQVDHRQAQVDLIEEVLSWADVTGASNILDVGCGIGGSALYLADKFNCTATGITLSKRQCARANERAAEHGLEKRAHFQVADALDQPFPDNHFDLVWSCESGEHMPDKERFLAECTRVLAPGGKLVIVTWCHRSGPPVLSASEERHLSWICRSYFLPAWVPPERYATLGEQLGLEQVHMADWTDAVKPFWPAVIRQALRPSGLLAILRGGPLVWRGGMALGLMMWGFQRGLIRYALCTGVKSHAT